MITGAAACFEKSIVLIAEQSTATIRQETKRATYGTVEIREKHNIFENKAIIT